MVGVRPSNPSQEKQRLRPVSWRTNTGFRVDAEVEIADRRATPCAEAAAAARTRATVALMMIADRARARGKHTENRSMRLEGTDAVRGVALLVPCLVLTVYIGRPWRWFTLHPLLMTLAFVVAAGSGIAIKKRGGRINTITHGFCMIVAFVLAMAGWYVIHEQKKMLGKPHWTTWHSWQGIVACGGYALGAAGGLIGLHPDFGMLRTSQQLRWVHRTLSRSATVAALLAIGTGYAKLADAYTPAVVAIALLALAAGWSLFECLYKPPSLAKGRVGGDDSVIAPICSAP